MDQFILRKQNRNKKEPISRKTKCISCQDEMGDNALGRCPKCRVYFCQDCGKKQQMTSSFRTRCYVCHKKREELASHMV